MTEIRQLSAVDEKVIHQKLIYILTAKNFQLLRNASCVSLITALIPVFAFYHSVDKVLLFSWLAAMTIVHLSCIALVAYYKSSHPDINSIVPWKNVARVGVFFSTFTWGIMGVLLVPHTAGGQNFILFFLIIISSSVAMGTSVDYFSSSVSILNSLAPYILWQLYEGFTHASKMHVYAGMLLILYLGFLLVVSFVSYQLMKKSVELSFRNMALASKLTEANTELKDLNNELEDRVILRTKELNSALTTVTYQATHDIVTSLPNQVWVLQYISELIMKSPQQHFAIACLAINSMENITDRYGYYANDTVIKEVGERLVQMLENNHQDIAYKIAIARRDAFVIVIENTENLDINHIIEPIFKVFEQPIKILHNNIFEHEQLFCSIGYSLYPEDAVIADQLLIKADTAMFYTKKQYENNFEHRFEPYNKEITETLQYRIQLRKNIQVAIDKNEFYLCYQPLVEIKSGLIINTEALLRWVHPVTGIPVSPAEIVKVAEDYNLIIPLGEWVLREACSQNYLWYKLGFKNIVSVNLSAKQLERGDIIQTITQILEETHLRPELLELELTETEAFKDNMVPVINNLRDLGVGLSIDDYGQGFSNLRNLKKFSFNKIKIDMEFIKNLPEDVNSQIIVTSSIKMAKALGIKVVAEGVETQEQYDFLAKHECDLIQGYLLYKPLIAAEITQVFVNQQQYFL